MAVLSAFSLRILLLGHKSLWLDEAFSLSVTKAGQNALWSGTFENHHPPLFYFLQKYWIRLGESEYILRLLSSLFGTASVPLIYFLGKRIAGKEVALSAAWISALSPLLIWYSQEARSYSLLIFIGLAVMLAVVNLFLKPNLGWAGLFIVTMTAAIYTHYGAFLLVPLQLCLIVFLKARQQCRKKAVLLWLLSWIFIFAAYWPWLRSPAARDFFNRLKTGSYPVQLAADRLGLDPRGLMGILVIVLVLVIFIGIFVSYKIFQKHDRFWTTLRTQSRFPGLLVFLFFVFLVVSVIPRGYSIKKQLVILWPYVLLFFCWFWPWEHKNKKLLAVVFSLSLISSLINIRFIPKDEWRQTVNFIHAQSQENDAVVLLPSYARFTFDYYSREKIIRVGVQPSSFIPELESLLKNHSRIWLVSNRANIVDPDRKIETWLEAKTKLVMARKFYLIQADLYQK